MIRCEPAGGDDAVNVKMVLETLGPDLEHVEEPDLRTQVSRIAGDVGELHKRGVQFKSLTDATDIGTAAASGRFFFHVIGSLAEIERELTLERTQADLKVARQLGPTGGRNGK